MTNKKDQKASISIAILPAIIAALAGIVGSFFSYKAGIATIQIPLNATQTAESRQTTFTATSPATSTVGYQTNIPIAIDSTKDWQNSGVYMSKGDTAVIRVVGGAWTTSRRNMTESEISQLPENIRGNEIWIDNMLENWGTGSQTFRCVDINLYDCPLPTENLGALIGKIGASEPFLIGSENKIIAPADGWLFFRINDSLKNLNDNHGILAVEIIK